MKTKDITRLAYKALKEAVAGVIEENKRLGLPLWVDKGGRVIKISPVTLKPIPSKRKKIKKRPVQVRSHIEMP